MSAAAVDGLPADLMAQVAARAKAAMYEHTQELEERVTQVDRQRAQAETRAAELQVKLKARDEDLLRAQQQVTEARAELKRSQQAVSATVRAEQQEQLGSAAEAHREQLAASHTRCEELEAALHTAEAQLVKMELEWRSKCTDLEATLGDEQAKRKLAESTLQQMQNRVADLSSETAAARNEMEENSRRHRAEVQALTDVMHGELLTEQVERQNANKRKEQLQLQLERAEQELAQTKCALSRTVESHARAQDDTKSSADDALLQESLRVKSAELSVTRARQAVADKEDELAQMSAQLQHVTAELLEANNEAKLFQSSSRRTVTELQAQVQETEKRAAAREQEWVDKTKQIVAQAAALKKERDVMQVELDDAHRLRESETTAAAMHRDEATSHLSNLAKAQASTSEAVEAGVQAREALREKLGGEISSLKLELQVEQARTQSMEKDAQAAREELARTLKSLEIAQRSLEEQTRVSAENAASLRGEAAAASARSADLTDRCSALERERDRALRQIESGAERIQTLTIERDLSTKSARESVEAAERKCALQTQALARSEAWAATAESSLQAAEECSEAAREEDKEAIRREAAIRESLEAEVAAMTTDLENLEHLNAALKSQVVVLETDARRMQLRFAQASAKLGVPLSSSQQNKLQRNVDGAMRRHNSVAATHLNLPPKAAAPALSSGSAGAGPRSGGKPAQ